MGGISDCSWCTVILLHVPRMANLHSPAARNVKLSQTHLEGGGILELCSALGFAKAVLVTGHSWCVPGS